MKFFFILIGLKLILIEIIKIVKYNGIGLWRLGK